jgi:hypothetical protein
MASRRKPSNPRRSRPELYPPRQRSIFPPAFDRQPAAVKLATAVLALAGALFALAEAIRPMLH